jgi:alpha 1,3-glucosidase
MLILFLKIPVYQCGGVIIPQRLRKRRASTLAIHDPITLVVALDRNVRD